MHEFCLEISVKTDGFLLYRMTYLTISRRNDK